MATEQSDAGTSALQNISDAAAILGAYRHGAGSELIGKLLSESDQKSTWYEQSSPPDLGSADDELSRRLRNLQAGHAQIVAKFERVTNLLDGMRSLAEVLLNNWSQAIDADPDEVLEAVRQKIAEAES
jgi:hypothetical protein